MLPKQECFENCIQTLLSLLVKENYYVRQNTTFMIYIYFDKKCRWAARAAPNNTIMYFIKQNIKENKFLQITDSAKM